MYWDEYLLAITKLNERYKLACKPFMDEFQKTTSDAKAKLKAAVDPLKEKFEADLHSLDAAYALLEKNKR